LFTKPMPGMEKLKGPVPPDMATDRSAEDPLQMAAVPDRTAEVMGGPTTIVAPEPFINPGQAVASSTVSRVYVVVAVGETDTVCPSLMPVKLKDEAPSEYVTLKGPVPVSENVNVDGPPLQTATGEAATEPAAEGLTVTVAVPDPETVHPLASVTFPVIE
jgi:hypothetical protein